MDEPAAEVADQAFEGGIPVPDAARVESACKRWRLEVRGALPGGFRSAVFDCVDRAENQVVLKLPATHVEALREAAALREWASSGVVVRLLDFGPEDGALLLERLRPASPLPAGADETAIPVVADILAKLHRPPAGQFAFPLIEEIYPGWERRSLSDNAYERHSRGEPVRAEAGLARMPLASESSRDLCATAPTKVLLHGDFCDKNILWDGTRYVAIDPVPRIGDPASDVGFFAAGHPPVSGILDRAAAIALRLGLDPNRAQRWAAIWAIHQTCQAWRTDQPELDAFSASPELQPLLRPLP